MPPPNTRAPQFESAFREEDRTREFHSGPWGQPLHYRMEEAEDEFGTYQRPVEVDGERMQSGNLSDAPDDGGPDAAPGNRRGWSPT